MCSRARASSRGCGTRPTNGHERAARVAGPHCRLAYGVDNGEDGGVAADTKRERDRRRRRKRRCADDLISRSSIHPRPVSPSTALTHANPGFDANRVLAFQFSLVGT